jgi:hypothetical protein
MVIITIDPTPSSSVAVTFPRPPRGDMGPAARIFGAASLNCRCHRDHPHRPFDGVPFLAGAGGYRTWSEIFSAPTFRPEGCGDHHHRDHPIVLDRSHVSSAAGGYRTWSEIFSASCRDAHFFSIAFLTEPRSWTPSSFYRIRFPHGAGGKFSAIYDDRR